MLILTRETVPMSTIHSPQNPAIKHLVRLAESARFRREQQEVLLDGLHLLDACLRAGQQPLRVFVAESLAGHAETGELLQRVQRAPVWVSDTVLARASELKTPTGLLSVWRPPQPARTARRTVWLDEVQDPGNVGSILRSAAAAGFDAVYLSEGCADVWSPRVLRAAMGAHFLLDIHPQADLLTLASTYSGSLLVTSLEGSVPLPAAPWSLPLAWVFGNEGEGVRPELVSRASQRVRIPMPGAMESLNVAAAAAICLFEDVRRGVVEAT